VYTFDDLLLAALASGVIGVLVGVLVTRQLSPQRKENRELENRLEKAEEQLSDYRHQVTEHFSHTSALVNNLTDSYRDVHEYLSASAMKLSDMDISQPVIIADAQSNLAKLAAGQSVEPPKDYAPKSEDAPGTLSEEYGLKEAKEENEEESELPKAVNDPS